MQENTNGVTLDSKRVDEEELRPPTLFPVSIITCKTEFIKPVNNILVLKLTEKGKQYLREYETVLDFMKRMGLTYR